MLRIDENRRGFQKDGKHFFYLADTCWSAFTNIEEEDWAYYSENRKMPYFLAGEFCGRNPVRPVINGEPCYEQMGYSRNMYGRFGRYEVRKAAWQSILGGACAGITYGAAGIYAWDTFGKKAPLSSEGFDKPNPWNLAVHYPGAWDYGYISYLLGMYGIQSLIPKQGLIAVPKEGMLAGSCGENGILLVYAPYNTAVCLHGDFRKSECHMIDLETRNVCENSRTEFKDGITKFFMPPFERDLLIVIRP